MKCPVCSNDQNFSLVETFMDYNLISCPCCELVFSDPMKEPGASFYERLYADLGHFDHIYPWRWCFDQFLQMEGPHDGNLLEIGCGNGIFLNRARSQGYQVTGLDFNTGALENAKEVYGLTDLHAISLNEFRVRFPERRFDKIAAFHLLEHLEDPAAFVETASLLLNGGGQLILAVPNQKGWQLRYKTGIAFWDHPPHHLSRWNKKSFNALLSKEFSEINFFENSFILDESGKILNYLTTFLSCMFSTGIMERARLRKLLASKSSPALTQNNSSRPFAVGWSLITRLINYSKGHAISIIKYIIFPFSYPIIKNMVVIDADELLVVARKVGE